MKQFLIALDQLVNVMLGGQADETLSARAWRNRDRHSFLQGNRHSFLLGQRR